MGLVNAKAMDDGRDQKSTASRYGSRVKGSLDEMPSLDHIDGTPLLNCIAYLSATELLSMCLGRSPTHCIAVFDEQICAIEQCQGCRQTQHKVKK